MGWEVSCSWGCCGKPCGRCGQPTVWDVLDSRLDHDDPDLDRDHGAILKEDLED